MPGSTPDLPQLGELPPFPWPLWPEGGWDYCSPGEGDRCLGGVGTSWFFHVSDLADRLLALGAQRPELETLAGWLEKLNGLLQQWTSHLGSECPPPPGETDPVIGWVTPWPHEIREDPYTHMKVLRVGVHAALGTDEEVLHVQQLVAGAGGTLEGLDAADLAAIGGELETLWNNFLESEYITANKVKSLLCSALTYDEMRLTLLDYQTPPTKPTVIIPTVYHTNAVPKSGTGSGTRLPNQIAFNLTLLTAQRGRAQRGRVYLGGLVSGILGADGLFNTSNSRGVATKFGEQWVAGIAGATFTGATSLNLAVVSTHAHVGNVSTNAYAGPSALGVGGVKAGAVPDTQRRRRGNRPEQSYLCWGSLPS